MAEMLWHHIHENINIIIGSLSNVSDVINNFLCVFLPASSGTPRQDVPGQVYRDAAMFDDIFDRQGRLFTGRKTPKITSPLNTLEYNRQARNYSHLSILQTIPMLLLLLFFVFFCFF